MVTATITSENGAAIAVSQFGVSVVHPEGITSIWARLTADQRRALAEALDPGRVPAWAVAPDGTPRVHPAPAVPSGRWTRDDLQRKDDLASRVPMPFLFWQYIPPLLDQVVDHLNAHHPKPDGAAGTDIMRRAARSERTAERHWPADQLAQGADTIDSLRTQLDRLERQRDAAVERAEAHAKGATRANLDRDKAEKLAKK